jgi:hypothetical protein
MAPAYRPDLADGWLSTDGEVCTAESGLVHAKHPRGLVVYRRSGRATTVHLGDAEPRPTL